MPNRVAITGSSALVAGIVGTPALWACLQQDRLLSDQAFVPSLLCDLAQLTTGEARLLSRQQQLGLVAAELAWRQAGLPELRPNLALGYGFGQGWRVEAEYIGYYSPASNFFTLNGQASQVNGNQIATNAIQFNVLKDIRTGSSFSPYIGGGVGFASSQYNVQEGSVTGTTFAGQGKVGVSYAINKATSAYVGYRIMGIGGNTTLSFLGDKPTTGSRLQQGLDAGIRIKL